MEKKGTNRQTILFVLVTIVLIWTPLLTPVHELGHFLASYSVGGHAEFIAINRTMCYTGPIFRPYVTAMGEGFIGIVFLLVFLVTRKNYQVGVMLKTACIFLPVEFITLTDHEEKGAFPILVIIMILCWRIAFGPFRKK